MVAIKPYFYKLHEDMPDVCEGLDIQAYLKDLRQTFGVRTLRDVDPNKKLPGGPVYYSAAPRNCHQSAKKYELEDAISDCLRDHDPEGKAKKALAELIASQILKDERFRENLLAYNRVPDSWIRMLQPLDPDEKPKKADLVEALVNLQDRDYKLQHNAKGKRHPLARMLESESFTMETKLAVVSDHLIGRRRGQEGPWSVRIGHRGNYREFNRAAWLEQNNAFVLRTVGDVVKLTKNFTDISSGRLKDGASPDVATLEAGSLNPSLK